MEKKIMLFLFLIISSFSFSQNFDFDSKYNYARYLASKNPDSSEIVLNSIIDSARKQKEPAYLAKAYYLKSYNCYLRSDAKGTLDFAQKALTVSNEANYAPGKALAYKMQGAQYAKLGLLKEAFESLNKGLFEIKSNNTDEGHELKGMLYNSFLILLNQNEYQKKEFYSTNAIREFQLIKNKTRRNELLISAYTNFGYILSELKKFDRAKSFFVKALALAGKDNHYLRSNIFHDIGFSFDQQNKSDSAVFYYQKALKIANQYGFNEKKIDITEDLEEAYKKMNDRQNAEKYKLKKLELKDSISYGQKMVVNETLNQKEENFNQKLGESYKVSKGVIITCLILLFLLIIFIFYIVRLKKNHRILVKRIYEKGIPTASYEEISPEESTQDPTPISIPADLKISSASEENILNGLMKFEKNLDFNNKNVSLYSLSSVLNVNSKYLSAVIKKHKKLNFNQYINHLRIKYVIDQLKNEPQYRKYKINHLSEITGYSSHSAFSLEFKKITGMHPSAFIKALETIS
ncbi:tetratricopeptide repeat protein [Chryseobacterium rhizosphaerae]|uniref:HTH araC/xylS-type domain-containing protein n=1 Tax=Chryseobacterium rhizosphaerae TaxID=395937 RepID=A0ABX9IG55_9FLAO|nr:tetratricopeptide repeat protein [Chryseobacterium rhizosphaerae]REC71811.1 hypothetical protein DRF57_20115 [Chryseobacterium rhizosphaerae]GEN69168.1 hypothetical protein CRH01_37360 [Chryseobacterium rhizosphaerae]